MNNDVAFGDVNLSEDGVGRGPPHNPGQGGWPTIRYFNKETGLEGGTYVKKTDGAMCEELGGDGTILQEYVEEFGKTSLCDIRTKRGCSDKETTYIDKMASKSSDEQNSQLNRLLSISGGSIKPELKDWIVKRTKILQQLVKAGASEEEAKDEL